MQNTPIDELESDLAMDDPRFEMIKGPVLSVQEKECSFYRSIHHAKALNLALAYTGADLILILDPDCFILMHNWMEQITKHMKLEDLVFLGVPYHPKYYTHYRGFPNAICMFINRRLMQEQNYFSLDFTPVFEGWIIKNKAKYDALDYYCRPKHIFQFFFSSKRKFFSKKRDFLVIGKECVKRLFYKCFSSYMKRFMQSRLAEFKCRDTGYRIYDLYRFLLKHQTFEIFALDQRSFREKFIESILPDCYRTFPRNSTFIRKTASQLFREFEANGEEFF
ncbi:MAG TPA: hypothetical protein VFU89_00325, partial [Rhabdochlamydiaceae bacterium]|nr:hypothetical protein [Rhabdochlamydiaceae bacterium]